ncbi:hypothetical protein HMPREF9412_2009 [Paenibacillus sp. HGF5]|nr:hypothetical protein HMPREF9412_2009 [Paenibacillus sp. HGF5]
MVALNCLNKKASLSVGKWMEIPYLQNRPILMFMRAEKALQYAEIRPLRRS